MPYHHGKLICEAKTMVTESLDELIELKAKEARCLPAELCREALFLFFTGNTFTGHVANDRRSVMAIQVPTQGDKGASQ